MIYKRLQQILLILLIFGTIRTSIIVYQDKQTEQRVNALREEVLSNLEIGMSRSEVEPIVQKAKVHYYCERGTFIDDDYVVSDDYYLFDLDPKQAGAIGLRFKSTEQGQILTKIGDAGYYSVIYHASYCVKDP